MKRAIFLLVLAAIFVFMPQLQAEDNNAVQSENKDALAANDKAIKKINAEAAKTEEALKQKADKADDAKKEAESIAQEKDRIAKEYEIKEEAASVAKKELEVVTKEADTTGAPELRRKARELAKESRQLDKEAAIYRDKLKVAERKARLAEKKLTANQSALDSLKKELADLRSEKASMRSLLEKLLASAGIILAAILVFFAVKFLIMGLEAVISRKKTQIRASEIALRIKTLGKIFYWMSGIGIAITAVYMILETFGVSVAPLLAGAGIVGLAFGFGGQYLIRDVINGFFILLEGQYRIDDVVKIGDYGGLVEDLNLRITTLRDLEGRVIIIPNGEIKTVVNFTREHAQALFDIKVAYKENLDKVIEAIKEAGKELRADPNFGKLILDDLEMLGVDDFTDSAVIIKFRIKTLPIKQWDVAREFRRRLKNRFDELGIGFPFPHRTLYWGEGQGPRPSKK